MYQKILVPLDGSPLAEQVLPYVEGVAKCMNSELILLRVPVEPFYDNFVAEPAANALTARDSHTGAVGYLENVALPLRLNGFKVSVVVERGDVTYQTILDIAKLRGADLIAMSTHGRGGLARLVLGSVADEVLRRSPVPVLLINPHPAQRGEIVSNLSHDSAPTIVGGRR